MYAVGLMSGTSLDGVDAVLCDIEGFGIETKIKQLEFETYTIPDKLKSKIKKCCDSKDVSTDFICSLNFEMGELFADAVLSICKKADIKSSNLYFVASHGQTVFHIPKPYGDFVASTMQIGESSIIAQRCKCTVISNFRVMDISAGGQGAPLVPYSEYILYRSNDKSIALQNIGGIGNVTVLPKGCNINDVFAFDTGPGNMVIDEAMQILFNKSYDKNGDVAKSGKIIEDLKNELKNHSYIYKNPPKTTGREMFGEEFTKNLISKYIYSNTKEDIIKTLTWFTSYSITKNYKKFILNEFDISEVIIGGGGAYNKTLINILKDMLPNINILTQEDIGYCSESKEAVAFVILGNETINKRPSNVPKCTGANSNVILGNITYSY